MKRSKNIIVSVAVALAATVTACSDDDTRPDYNPIIDNPQTEEPAPEPPAEEAGSRNEQYRPQVHFTPAKNWVNDPNGMVYANGTYHLFYQYNPQGNVWGNLSWGHATSTDLIHWKEQAVALQPDDLGMIFSGSAVIDKQNTSGFGANAMVAIYTSATSIQQQSLAYSTDGGMTFTKYEGNPIIRNPYQDDNFRDPKVFWHEESQKWMMCLAHGWKMGMEIWSSKDLKHWQHESDFYLPISGRPSFQWECPDLLSFDYQGKTKWVMLVSVNPGGPVLGSGIMYFIGDFNGKQFTADAFDYPLWLDYGMDNYAGVTWSNTDKRRILIGWMNNWQYADQVPCSPWRSAMTLPRELSLAEYDGQLLLSNNIVPEISSIAGEWKEVKGDFETGAAYHLRLMVDATANSTVTLGNGQGEQFCVDIVPSRNRIIVHRNASTGKTSFSPSFSIPSIQAPLYALDGKAVLDFYVDRSSIELFTGNGLSSTTNLVFPQSLYHSLTVSGATYSAQVRELKRIWE